MNVADQPSPPPIDNVDEVAMLANATDTTLSSDPLPGSDHDALVSKGRDVTETHTHTDTWLLTQSKKMQEKYNLSNEKVQKMLKNANKGIKSK
jgi:striatin 1/3/4